MTIERKGDKFRARINHDGVRYTIGAYPTEAEARSAYDRERQCLDDGTSTLLQPGARLTLAEYAKRLGVRYGTVRRWASESMPCIRQGSIVRVNPADADPWVAAHRASTVAFSRTSVIYVVRRESDGAIKIGWTSRIEARIAELRKEAGADVRLLGAIEGDKPDELRLHAEFAEHRIDGEWFKMDGKDALRALVRGAA